MEKNSARLNQQRNRQKLRYRLMEGIKSVFLPMFSGLIPVSILTVLFFLVTNRTFIFNTHMSGLLFVVFDYIKIAALALVYLAFLLALLVRLGTPYKSRTAENAAMSAFKLQTTPSECPILISSKLVTFGRRRWEFFSMWVPLEEWQQKPYYSKILNSLGCHLVGQIKHGGKEHNNSHRIVFYTRPGAGPIERGVLTDEEI